MAKFLWCAALLLALTGCSQTMQEQFTYIDKVTTIQTPEGEFRIREHPSRDRLMVTPGWGKITSAGLTQGATFGAVRTLPTQAQYEAAARQHMVSTGRANCRMTSSNPLMAPHYQVLFDCSAAATHPQ